MLAQFQARYPTGSLISELLRIYQGKFVVRVSAQVEGMTRATGMAAAETPELAEDRARVRALAVLAIDSYDKPPEATTIQSSGQLSDDVMPEEAEEAIEINSELLDPITQENHQAAPKLELKPTYVSVLQASPLAASTPDLEFPEQESDRLMTPITQENHQATPKLESNPTYVSVLQASPLAESTPDLEFLEQESNRSFAPTPENQEVIAFDKRASVQETNSSNPPLSFGNVTPLIPRSYNLQESATSLGETAETKMLTISEPVDLSDLIARTNVELKRLGWNNQKGREYLEQKYNKRSRQHLNDQELLEFLHYLESLPSP